MPALFMIINRYSLRILLIPLLVLPMYAVAQLSRGSQQVRIVELDPTLGLSTRQLIDGKGDLKSWDLSIDSQSPLANLPQFVDREAPILEVECFYPDLKLIYRDYTYLISTHCGVIHKYRNLKPWQPSRYPLADDFIFTESLVRYFHTLRDSLFGGRFDAFFEALSESTPSAYAVHLQRQGRAEPEVLLSDVEIIGKHVEPETAKPNSSQVKSANELAVTEPARPLPAPRGDLRDTPQPPQRRGSVPKIIHTPTSGSDLPAYMKSQPVVRKPKSDEEELLEIIQKDAFELEPVRPEPAPVAVSEAPVSVGVDQPEFQAALRPMAHPKSEPQEPAESPTEQPADRPTKMPVADQKKEPQHKPRPPRPQQMLTENLSTTEGRLPDPRIETPRQPVFDSSQLFAIVVTEPEIIPEPEPKPIQADKPASNPNLVAAKPEPKPVPVAKPGAPAPVTKPESPAAKAAADEVLDVDVDLGLEDTDDYAEEDTSEDSMENIEGLMDDDRDGFIDEIEGSDRDINALFGDDDDDLDFDDDDDLDLGDF